MPTSPKRQKASPGRPLVTTPQKSKDSASSRPNLSILFIVSLLFTVLFAISHWGWLNREVADDFNDFLTYKDSLDTDYRMQVRFGNSFTISKDIATAWRAQKAPENGLILVPLPPYFKKNGVKYLSPEPAVFYYFTGVKTISPSCQGADSAKWVVMVHNHQIVFKRIANPQVADSLVRILQ